MIYGVIRSATARLRFLPQVTAVSISKWFKWVRFYQQSQLASSLIVVDLIPSSGLQHIKTIITTAEVLIRDLFYDTIITIVEELQRRLPPAIFDFIGQGEDKEGTGVQLEAQTS
ncbi:hypothetical protein L1887_22403 [Cichorium endivia]|nr:hypothetical protein L1887_22403 [Cichorium endivia]